MLMRAHMYIMIDVILCVCTFYNCARAAFPKASSQLAIYFAKFRPSSYRKSRSVNISQPNLFL